MLKTIITAILTFLAWWLKRETKPEMTDGKTNDKIKQAGASKIKHTPPLIALLFITLLLGCNRTVYVPNGAVVRLRDDIENVVVWVQTEDGWVAGKLTIPEGWYCMPLTDKEIEQQDD
jgi:nitrogen fixation protein